MENELTAILTFLEKSEKLKGTLRTAWDSEGKQESTAEHSWRLALMTACLLPYFPEINAAEALEMALLHDLAESVTGDISAFLTPDATAKSQQETAVFFQLTEDLPLNRKNHFQELFIAYEQNTTTTAHFIKALDKAETILQHNQGKNPAGFHYEFNLDYGKKYFTGEVLTTLRALLDAETKKNLQKNTGEKH